MASGAALSSSLAPVSRSPRIAIRTFNLLTSPSERNFVLYTTRTGNIFSFGNSLDGSLVGNYGITVPVIFAVNETEIIISP